ncbi:MAG: Hsp70 family protein [Planctomycetia bacterium]|nr:Hsp70 family protein [Planctomycetia bacterium]
MSRPVAVGPPVGIDLGTTFSVVATVDAQGRPRTIQNAEGDITTPSVVMFDRSSVIVGKEAVKLASFEPEAIAAYAKRDIGATRLGKAIRGHHLPPEVVQSFVLRKLKADAELKLGPVRQAVVTVPAYFNEPRRKATQDAGRLADLEILDILNEPTAAAIAYGAERGFLNREGLIEKPETVLVYDLGGGTFDATLMHLEGHDYTALATAGDVYLGGIDWDQRIVDFVAVRFAEQHGGLDPREDASALVRLQREAEEAKRALSARDDVNVTMEYEGRFLRIPVTRREFDMMTSDLLERTRFTIRKMLKEASLEWSKVSRLLLVGGSTRMAQVQKMLKAESGLEPDRSLAADEAVAHGAAVYAGFLLAGKSSAVHAGAKGNITNVSSHDLGVLGTEAATGRPKRRIIIRHNSRLPAKQGGRFFTQKKGQKTVVVRVVEGGDDSGHNATVIGNCTVTDLPADLPEHTPVDVVFQYEENGRLKINALLPTHGKAVTLEVARDSGLSEEQLVYWQQRIAAGQLMEDAEEAGDEVVEAVFDSEMHVSDSTQSNESSQSIEPSHSGDEPLDEVVFDSDESVIGEQSSGTGESVTGHSHADEDEGGDSDLNSFLRGLN